MHQPESKHSPVLNEKQQVFDVLISETLQFCFVFKAPLNHYLLNRFCKPILENGVR